MRWEGCGGRGSSGRGMRDKRRAREGYKIVSDQLKFHKTVGHRLGAHFELHS